MVRAELSPLTSLRLDILCSIRYNTLQIVQLYGKEQANGCVDRSAEGNPAAKHGSLPDRTLRTVGTAYRGRRRRAFLHYSARTVLAGSRGVRAGTPGSRGFHYPAARH